MCSIIESFIACCLARTINKSANTWKLAQATASCVELARYESAILTLKLKPLQWTQAFFHSQREPQYQTQSPRHLVLARCDGVEER